MYCFSKFSFTQTRKTTYKPMNKILLTILFLCLLTATVSAQERTVSGKVTDVTDGSGLPGVNVVVQGTTKGTTTDADGNFNMTLGPNENALIFSFVGYQSQTVTVGDQTTLNVALEGDVTSLQEIVVVGYGEQRKADITGSIASVDPTDIQRQPNVNPISALQGKVAGVQITNYGTPGSSPQIKIRGTGTALGSTTPLYVVDGVWYNDIAFLNPADITNISILKDASSQAIYGVRAANGVVLISTKRAGEAKVTVNYSGMVGSQVVTNQIEMASGPEFAEMINELDVIGGGEGRYEDPSAYGTTEWHRQVLRAAMITNHSISLSGAGEKHSFALSLGYTKQEGIVKGNDFKRYTARLQNEFKPYDFLKLGYTVTGAMNQSNDIPGGIFHELYSASPITPVYYSDNTYGDPNDFGAGSSTLFNPQVTLDYYDQQSRNSKITGSAYAELQFLKNFTFRTSVGGDFSEGEVRNYTPEYTATLAQRNAISKLTRNRNSDRYWILENTLTFNKDIGDDHSLTMLLGQSAQKFRNYYMSASAQNVPNSSVDDHYISNGDNRVVSDDGDLWTAASYFIRGNYSFRDRYLVTATLRADGSSAFSENERWGNFPSIGLGWVISEEDFFKGQNTVNTLKLRASWGRIGNNQIPSGITQGQISRAEQYWRVLNGTAFLGGGPVKLVPPELLWETSEGTDLGLEFSVLDSRLIGEVDYYIKDTKEAIFSAPILGSIGKEGSDLLTNQATFRNKGVELALTWQDRLGDSFTYSISGNISFNNNTVTEVKTGKNPLLQAVGTTGGAPNTRTMVGEPIGAFYGYQVIGVFQDEDDVTAYVDADDNIIQPTAVPGDFKFRDVNNDGVIDGKDRVTLGNPNARRYYGINTNFAYKGFDLTMDFQGVSGVEVYNAVLGARFGTENFTKDFYDNRWHGAGTSNTYPSANIGGGANYLSNSFYVEDGSYFRVRNIQIGYTLPSATTSRWKMSTLRVYANAQNALNFFNYRGMSPEIGGGPTTAGVDTNVYPLYATYNVGVNVTF
jgi:TonB-linked SusC/RagA family outer membrane protein